MSNGHLLFLWTDESRLVLFLRCGVSLSTPPPAEFDHIAVVARPLQVLTGTGLSEALWKAPLANRDTINKKGKTLCDLLLFEYFSVNLPIFPPASCLEIPALGRGEGEAVSSTDSLWSQDHVRHEAVLSMPAGSHSLSFRSFPASAEWALLSFFSLFHGHKCILLFELLCPHVNYHKKTFF